MHSMSLFGSSVAWWRVMLGLAVVPAVAQVHLRGENGCVNVQDVCLRWSELANLLRPGLL